MLFVKYRCLCNKYKGKIVYIRIDLCFIFTKIIGTCTTDLVLYSSNPLTSRQMSTDKYTQPMALLVARIKNKWRCL